MMRRVLPASLCLALVGMAAWIGTSGSREKQSAKAWIRVAEEIYRSPGLPAGYAVVAGDRALLIDAPQDADGLRAAGVKKIDGVLLTHHHRDTCAAVTSFLAARVPVRAPKTSAEWLTPEHVS